MSCEDNASRVEDNASRVEDNASRVEDNASRVEDNASRAEDIEVSVDVVLSHPLRRKDFGKDASVTM
jgi:hypothetical protein